MLEFKKLIQVLKENQRFLITCHVNPDADAIGSEIAMAGILKQLKKNYYVLNTSSTPYNLTFLDKENIINKFDEEKHGRIFKEIDVAIFLDLNFLSRTVRMEKYFQDFNGVKICIDHHTNPEGFADYNFIDESKSATGEIIYDLISCCDTLKLNNELALPIYAAIMTDTGSFRFSKTNSTLHKKVSKLLKYNLNPEDIYDKIYAQYEFSRNKLLGEALHTIELTNSGKVSYMTITQESLIKSGAVESDVDGFVNYALTTKGVQIGILFFELKDGIKISFRSKGKIPVNKLAEVFNGGGHLNASGTRLYNVKLKEIMPKVINKAEEYFIKNL